MFLACRHLGFDNGGPIELKQIPDDGVVLRAVLAVGAKGLSFVEGWMGDDGSSF